MRWSTAVLVGALACAGCDQAAAPEDPVPTHPSLALAARVSITDLGTLPGGTFSFPLGLNDRGQVLGHGDTDVGRFFMHAFLWEHGRLTDLGLDEDDLGSKSRLNQRGQV